MPSPLDFANPNAGFQSLPPEVLAYMQQQGNPLVGGLMGGAPPQPAQAGPPHQQPQGPPTMPMAQVTPPPLGAGQNALLDAGSAMLMNSGYGQSLGQALGAGLASGKASFVATKNAEADRKMQLAAMAALGRGWAEAERRGLVPEGTKDSAMALPLDQQQKMLGSFLEPKPGIVAAGGSAWNVQTGKWDTPSPKPVPGKPDFTLKGPNGEEVRYNGDTGKQIIAGPTGPKPVNVSAEFRSAISAVSGGKTDDPTQLNIALGLKPDDKTGMHAAWDMYIRLRQASQTAVPPTAQTLQTKGGGYVRIPRGSGTAVPLVDSTGQQVLAPEKNQNPFAQFLPGASGSAPKAAADSASGWTQSKTDKAWYKKRPDGQWTRSDTKPAGVP